jgi:hypothetical protein
MEGLGRLMRSAPAAAEQYREMLWAGELEAAAEAAIAKRSRTPADVPEAEVNRWRECIRALLKARDPKALDVARREGGAGFEAAWATMSAAGEKMAM